MKAIENNALSFIMPNIEPFIRPPAEADNFLLQVTLGCSQDTCSFCGVYKNKPFCVKDEKEINADIDLQVRRHPDTRRVFLMDGDVLALSNNKLIPILEKLQQSFPKLTRVSSYANGCNITHKIDQELKELYENKLSLIYMGLESGSQAMLDQCGKTSSVEEMIEAVHRADKAKIKSSIIVLLGLGGKKNSKEHVAGTIEALNRMQPRYLSFLSLMILEGTPLAQQVEEGIFEELNSSELLKESYEIIKGIYLNKTIFRANHASNYLPLEGSLPKDKEMLLNLLDSAMSGKVGLKPSIFRGL